MVEIVSARGSKATMRLPETSPSSDPLLWNKTIDLHCDDPEALSIQAQTIADAVLAEISAPPVTVTQDGSAESDPHRFHVVLLLEGRGTYHWANGTATQAPGDIVVLDTAEPSQVNSPVDSRLLRWSLSEALVAPFLPASGGVPVLHLPARGGLMKVLACYACEFAREAGQLDSDAQHGLLAHLCGLLGLAIEAEKEPRPARRCNYRAFQRQRILTYIDTHLDNCRLTAKRAAKDLGISPRWLHALLEDSGVGFPELVARHRLEKSLRLLQDPASDHLSIAEIAFLSGFNELSTFYRRFGDRYRTTPGQVRRQAA